jgi:hypothetical protein
LRRKSFMWPPKKPWSADYQPAARDSRALPMQCPFLAEADIRPLDGNSGFDPEPSLRLRRSTGIPALPQREDRTHAACYCSFH